MHATRRLLNGAIALALACAASACATAPPQIAEQILRTDKKLQPVPSSRALNVTLARDDSPWTGKATWKQSCNVLSTAIVKRTSTQEKASSTWAWEIGGGLVAMGGGALLYTSSDTLAGDIVQRSPGNPDGPYASLEARDGPSPQLLQILGVALGLVGALGTADGVMSIGEVQRIEKDLGESTMPPVVGAGTVECNPEPAAGLKVVLTLSTGFTTEAITAPDGTFTVPTPPKRQLRRARRKPEAVLSVGDGWEKTLDVSALSGTK